MHDATTSCVRFGCLSLARSGLMDYFMQNIHRAGSLPRAALLGKWISRETRETYEFDHRQCCYSFSLSGLNEAREDFQPNFPFRSACFSFALCLRSDAARDFQKSAKQEKIWKISQQQK